MNPTLDIKSSYSRPEQRQIIDALMDRAKFDKLAKVGGDQRHGVW
jgi:hypothetical protein